MIKALLRPVLLVGLGLAIARAAGPAFPFAEATIDDLQARMAAGTLTARELTAAYLRRIAEVDQAGPKLKAVLEVNPDALAIAEKLDAERKAGTVRGPLHGIPILIKDNIATADGMETTAGSLALVGARPLHDAPLVARLRDAGAVILGKANLSEWANFRGSGSISGWSARGGQTLNPYALDRNPSGSSTGSAVAVAANLCVAAIGTETVGSIVSPASQNGVVGVKPTVGLVSRTGIIPIAATFDTAGPMTRTVRDAAIVLGALAGADPRDPATQGRPAELPVDFAAALRPGALKGARIGVLHGPFDFRPSLEGVLAAALEKLRAAGAVTIEAGEFPGLAATSGARIEVMLYEMKDGLNAYLATLGPGAAMKSLADLVRFNETHAEQELPLFGQQHFTRAQAKGPLTETAYLDARAKCLRLMRTEGIDALMDRHRLDALIAITNAPAGLPDPVFGGLSTAGGSAAPAAVAGYPSVTVPAAQMSGLPVGLSFFGRAWSEARLLALAADFEARTPARRVPKFLPSAVLR
ncbi:MAG: amidase [Verrucomicrobia bacterium]|nr:amidase [Verrucomicrobiota bacterium]